MEHVACDFVAGLVLVVVEGFCAALAILVVEGPPLVHLTVRLAWELLARLVEGACRCSVWLLGYLFATMVATVVVQQVVWVSCDAVWLITRLWAPRWPAQTPQWCLLCLSAWLFVLGLEMPLLGRSLPVQPVLVAWAQTAILSRAYRTLLRLVLGRRLSAGALSARCQLAHKQQAALVHLRSGGEHARTFGLLLAGYALMWHEDLRRAWRWSLLTCVCLAYIQIQRISSRGDAAPLKLWKILWEITPEPVHACQWALCSSGSDDAGAEHVADQSSREAADDDCDVHGTCAICLDSLCARAAALAEGPRAVLRRRRPALALCRRPGWGGEAGLSATRSWGTQLYKSYFTGLARRVAKLPCGHEFHLGCIDDAARVRLQCPTCRASFGDTWGDLTDEERFCVRIGWAAVMLVWLVLWAGQGHSQGPGGVDGGDGGAAAAAAAAATAAAVSAG